MANDFLDYTDAFGHRIITAPLPESQSLSIEGEPCTIGIDAALSRVEQRVRLAHELGHCQRGAFYHEFSPLETVGRCENKARVYSYRLLAPPCAIYYAIKDGNYEPWQLAEVFGVTDEFMIEALTYYKEKQGICYDALIRELTGE